MATPDEDTDELLVKALVDYLDDTLRQEDKLRAILSRAQHNDPTRSVSDCLEWLVRDYLRLRTVAPS